MSSSAGKAAAAAAATTNKRKAPDDAAAGGSSTSQPAKRRKVRVRVTVRDAHGKLHKKAVAVPEGCKVRQLRESIGARFGFSVGQLHEKGFGEFEIDDGDEVDVSMADNNESLFCEAEDKVAKVDGVSNQPAFGLGATVSGYSVMVEFSSCSEQPLKLEIAQGPNTTLHALSAMIKAAVEQIMHSVGRGANLVGQRVEVRISTLSFDLPGTKSMSESATLADLGMSEQKKTVRVFCTVYSSDKLTPVFCFSKQAPSPASISAVLSVLEVAHHKLHHCKNECLERWASFENSAPTLRALARFFDAPCFTEVDAPDVSLLVSTIYSAGRFLLEADFSLGVLKEAGVLSYARHSLGFILSTPKACTGKKEVDAAGTLKFPTATTIVSSPVSERSDIALFFNKAVLESNNPVYVSNLPTELETEPMSASFSKSREAVEHGSLFQEKVKTEGLTMALRGILPIGDTSTASSSAELSLCWLQIVPSNLLRDSTSRVPCLCYNEKKELCIFTGIPACSNGIVEIYEPLKESHRSVQPGLLARSLASSLGGDEGFQLVDSRPPSELLIVAFDRSNSMNGKAFRVSRSEKEKEEREFALPPVPVTREDAFDAMIDIRQDIWFPLLHKTIERRIRPASEVFATMAMLASPFEHFIRCMTDQHPRLCLQMIKAAPGPPESLPKEIQDIGQYTALASDPTFQIFFFHQKTYTIDVRRNWTLRRVKRQISSIIGASISCLRIQYGGRTLEDHKTLHDYKITKHRRLEIGFRSHSQWFNRRKPKSSVSQTNDDATPVMRFQFDDDIVISLSGAATVEELAVRYCSAARTLPHKFTLWSDFKDDGDGTRVGTLLFNFYDLNSLQRTLSSQYPNKTKVNIELGGPRTDPKKTFRHLSRLDCSKQLFQNFINRAQAYNFPSQMGLVIFGTDVKKACDLTGLIESFRDEIEEIDTSGGTALYNAISVSAQMLVDAKHDIEKRNNKAQNIFDKAMEEYNAFLENVNSSAVTEKGAVAETIEGAKAPRAPPSLDIQPIPKMRILVLSDGRDEDSPATMTPETVLATLRMHGITLDAIILGKDSHSYDNPVLKSIAHASGGYAFAPQNVEEAIKITEHETMVSGCDRPICGPKANLTVKSLLRQMRYKDYHYADSGEVLQRKRPDEMKRAAETLDVALTKMNQRESSGNSNAAVAVGSGQTSGKIAKRLMHELRKIQKASLPHIDVYPSLKNIRFWKIVIEAPSTKGIPSEIDRDCLYSGANFALYIQFPMEFPDRPPEVRFITPITHVNVNSHGRICHGILGRDWNPRTSVKQVLDCIYGLLLHPDIDDALDSRLAFLARQQPNTDYVNMVKSASADPRCLKTREEWSQVMLSGENNVVIDLVNQDD